VLWLSNFILGVTIMASSLINLNVSMKGLQIITSIDAIRDVIFCMFLEG
jgi:hypothetical protein